MRRAGLVVAIAVLLAGCGGGGGRLSRQDFDAKGNAICRKYTAKQRQVANPQNLAQLGPALHKLLPLADQQINDLSKLKPPKGDDATWKALLAGAHQENDFVKNQLIPAADDRDLAKIRRLLSHLQAMDQQNNEKARGIGLTDCAQQGT